VIRRLSFETTTQSVAETRALGKRLGRHAPAGATVILSGDLGSGKTALVQGIARGLKVPEEYYITSPSFTLVNEYPGRMPLCHVDLYRLEEASAIEDIGLPDILAGAGVVAVEWGERLGAALPDRHLRVQLRITGNQTRRMTMTAVGATAVAWLEKVAAQSKEQQWA
jgi:tRNA threonylcarbamoyladenosine biosynthesis protein TsaE